jgi:hypothetical protein
LGQCQVDIGGQRQQLPTMTCLRGFDGNAP